MPKSIEKIGKDIFIYGERLSKYQSGYYINYLSLDSLLTADALGRKIKTLVSKFRNSKIYSVTFDASNFSSGLEPRIFREMRILVRRQACSSA